MGSLEREFRRLTPAVKLINGIQPRRDGAMENDIVVHEMTHGITNRMTGGGTGRCLQSIEAAGMGEGWSDAMAECVELVIFLYLYKY